MALSSLVPTTVSTEQSSGELAVRQRPRCSSRISPPARVRSYPAVLTNVNNVLFLFCNGYRWRNELWKSDGTATGTVQVRDIHTAGNSSPYGLVNISGMLYFLAFEPATGRELWKSDGTLAGTVLVKDLRPGTLSSYVSGPTPFAGGLMFSSVNAHGQAILAK